MKIHICMSFNAIGARHISVGNNRKPRWILSAFVSSEADWFAANLPTLKQLNVLDRIRSLIDVLRGFGKNDYAQSPLWKIFWATLGLFHIVPKFCKMTEKIVIISLKNP